jgi:hypothetical protein
MSDINDVTHERQVADLPEARRLIHAICRAMFAYRDFLADHGLIWKDHDGLANGDNPCKVKKLTAEISYQGSEYGEACEINLIGGALDRAYSDKPVDDEGKPKPCH